MIRILSLTHRTEALNLLLHLWRHPPSFLLIENGDATPSSPLQTRNALSFYGTKQEGGVEGGRSPPAAGGGGGGDPTRPGAGYRGSGVVRGGLAGGSLITPGRTGGAAGGNGWSPPADRRGWGGWGYEDSNGDENAKPLGGGGGGSGVQQKQLTAQDVDVGASERVLREAVQVQNMMADTNELLMEQGGRCSVVLLCCVRCVCVRVGGCKLYKFNLPPCRTNGAHTKEVCGYQ